ncbi:M23 family metallopeptidase [Flavobacterium ginsengiterrae]|uniref:M23ase beta-sheet core domain-containing protein n=1 Tax=Flavobacterium ginsengiterrae TaxID=871695 RepID=A0ABP7GAM3_9FLAO
MAKLKIYGKSDPSVGIKEYYSIYDLFGSSTTVQLAGPNFQNIPDDQIKWSVWILLGGSWIKTEENNKTGATVEYTFSPKSLKRKGIRMLVDINGEKAVLDIKTKQAVESKIMFVELLDINKKKPTQLFSYGQTIVARVHCVNMEKFPIYVTLWEDDGGKGKENATDIKIDEKKGNILDGIVDVEFYLDPARAWLANIKPDANASNEGAFHEYYVTAEFYKKVSKPSKSVDVINPDYKDDPYAQKPAPKQQEPETKKETQTPAEKKGPSQKEQKGIAKSDRKAYDYAEKKVAVNTTVSFDPTQNFVDSMMKVGSKDSIWNRKDKLVIFPLLVKPENDIENKWGRIRNWASKAGTNMTTFNSNRDSGTRKHAARDLYTNALETVVAIADGKVLEVRLFYCETYQVTIRHTLKDGRDFIIRYGELDPKSITVKVGESVTQKQKLGKTGKLLKYLKKQKIYVPLMEIDDVTVFMLHFEHFSNGSKFDLKRFPTTNESKPYNRRNDLIDSLAILQEGYNNSFGSNSAEYIHESREFTEHDARLALMKIYDIYGKEMAKTIESIYRWEADHFKSDQYKICGSAGMETSGKSSGPNYGWDGSLYIKYPEYKPIGIWESFENKGKSGLGGNDQDKINKKKYIKFPSVEAAMMYIADFIDRHDGNVGRWHSLTPKVQEEYVKSIKTAIPRIVNKF